MFLEHIHSTKFIMTPPKIIHDPPNRLTGVMYNLRISEDRPLGAPFPVLSVVLSLQNLESIVRMCALTLIPAVFIKSLTAPASGHWQVEVRESRRHACHDSICV